MRPERWKQIDQLLEATFERPPEGRSAFLDVACAGDEALRREVESLLSADSRASRFIESPAACLAADIVKNQSALLEGQQIGRYRILSLTGKGGMGTVYLAEDTTLRRRVALKLLRPDFVQGGERLRRFEQEARAACALNHPNILVIHEIGSEGDVHFIVTEFVEGETLRERMLRSVMSVQEVLEVAVQVASALAEAHQAGIVHRDVKPENVMLRADGLVKVLDFGLAKLTERRSSTVAAEAPTLDKLSTEPGTILGTVNYMSPEQARGQQVDARSDIFSLGVMIYEMIAGRLPFEGETMSDVIASILKDEPVSLTAHSREIPREAESIVSRAICKDRNERYQTVNELLEQLKQFKQRLEFSLQAGTSLSSEDSLKPELQTPSIAVLPFVNISADPENEYFCDGLAEELINALTKIESMRVVARASAFSFKGKQTDVREIGDKLNVGTLLEGSVRKAGDRLRITAQLVNVADGFHLWSEQYDRRMVDIFDIQDDISLAIVAALKVKLLGAQKAAILKRYTDNTEAYQLYLKGRYHFSKYTEEGFRKSVEYFEQAMGREPEYAPAWTGLASSHLGLWLFGHLYPNETLPKVKMAITRALALDDCDAPSHALFALLKLYHDWDWTGAEREFQRAIELNQNNAEAHEYYGFGLAVVGRSEEAVAEGNRALELDPLSLRTNLDVGSIFRHAGQNDRLLEQGRKLIEMEPNFFGGYYLIAWGSWDNGRYEQAAAAYAKAFALGATRSSLAYLGCLYGIVGQREKAQQILSQFEELSALRYVPNLYLAIVYAGLGEADRAFEWLERAYVEREGGLLIFKHAAPRIPAISRDPRLADLFRRIGLWS